MTVSTSSVEKLDAAVKSLNDDAEGMHSLIQHSTEHLRKSIVVGEEATAVAKKASENLAHLTEAAETKLDEMATTLKRAESGVDELREENCKLRSAADARLDSVETRISDIGAAQDNALNALKEEIIEFKGVTKARFDSMESQIKELKIANDAANMDISEKVDSARNGFQKLLFILIFIGVADLVATITSFFL